MICSPVHTLNKFEVDSAKNSDESSTNNEATFSCDKCGQNFGSQQELKKYISTDYWYRSIKESFS